MRLPDGEPHARPDRQIRYLVVGGVEGTASTFKPHTARPRLAHAKLSSIMGSVIRMSSSELLVASDTVNAVEPA